MALQQLADKSYGMTFPGLSVEETLERLSEACRSKGPAYGFSLPYQMPLEIARSGDRIVAFHLGRHPFAVFEGRLQREKDETKLTGHFSSKWYGMTWWHILAIRIATGGIIGGVIGGLKLCLADILTAPLTLGALFLLYWRQAKTAQKMVLECLDDASILPGQAAQ